MLAIVGRPLAAACEPTKLRPEMLLVSHQLDFVDALEVTYMSETKPELGSPGQRDRKFSTEGRLTHCR